MKRENNYLWMIWFITWYAIKQKFQTNIRCWFGHKYMDTRDKNIKKCKRCGTSTLFMYAIYEEE